MSDFAFFSYAPRPKLAPFVDAVWGVRGLGDFSAEAVLPNGSVELMINFGPRQRVIGHGDRRLSLGYRRAWIAGIQDRRLVHASDSGVDHLSIRFRPGGAHAFFDLPMHESTNQVIELEDLIGAAATTLRDRLGEAGSDEARVATAQDWLTTRMRVAAAFPTVRRAVRMLSGGTDRRIPIGTVCERLGLSNKSLVDQFRRTVGLTPKVVARIERFQAVIGACRGRSRVSWVELAHAHGYADQPHLIREFRRLGSVTPRQFLANRTPDESHMVFE